MIELLKYNINKTYLKTIMKKIILVLVCMILFYFTSGQTYKRKINFDSCNAQINKNYFREIKEITETSNIIDIRFYKIFSIESSMQLLNITKSKRVWNCLLINSTVREHTIKSTDLNLKPKISYDSLFNLFQNNKLFELISSYII